MTARTMPARPEQDAGLRPVPWRRMAGVTWRQHRFALVAVAALLGAAGRCTCGSSASTCTTPTPPRSPATRRARLACQDAVNHLRHGLTASLPNGLLLQVVPALIGAFVGAPLLARETGDRAPSGTPGPRASAGGAGRSPSWCRSRLADGRRRAVQPGALPGTTSRSSADGNYALALNELSPFNTGLFDLRRVAFAAWTLAAFAIGALAGMLIRRVVPAIAATLAVYAGLAFATGAVLRAALPDAVAHHQPERVPLRVDPQPVVDQGRHDAQPVHDESTSSTPCSIGRYAPAVPRRRRPSLQAVGPRQREAVPHPARVHVLDAATSRAAGSGPSSGSRAAGCSRCRLLLIAATVWLVRRRAA